jgi:hypothetical protein
MADFFNNLLLRSSASAKTSGALLQPRLPSLFESTSGVDEIPSPRADGVLRESVSPSHEENNLPAFEHGANQAAELSARLPAQRLEPQSESKRRSANNPAADVPENDSDAGAVAPMPERPSGPVSIRLPGQRAKAPDPTVRAAQEPGGHAPIPGAQLPSPSGVPAAQTVEPERTVLAHVPVPPHRQGDASDPGAGPAAKTRPARAPQEDGQTPQLEVPPVVPRQVKERALSRLERDVRSDVQDHAPANTVRSRPDAASSAPVLQPVLAPRPAPAVSRPGALLAQAAQEQESVVQIHIGRIEVRAVTPPAAPRTVQATPSQPRMSLDDYLRQREEKK